jgi:hypothetical protein
MDAVCRSCGSRGLRTVLSLGETPLAEVLLREDQVDEPEERYSLTLAFCADCALVQLLETVDPEILYGGEYPYYTSVAGGLVTHFQASANAILERRSLDAGSLVVEAASNDGHMLRVFADRGIPILGVDPARGPAEVAERSGVPTLVDYFGERLASELRKQGMRADVILGNNVLNLLEDPNDFATAVDVLLTDTGVAIIEVPYVVATVDQGAFDNVFHQNVTYASATSMDALFRRHGLFVNDIEPIPTFGGSLRLSIERVDAPSERARELLAEEHDRGVGTYGFYANFAARARSTREQLHQLLQRLRANGDRIVAYGAAGGMATTLLTFVELDEGLLDFAVDANPHKHGWYTAGSKLLIRPTDALVDEAPEYVLLLAWNYEPEILEQQAEYRSSGGRFIVPIPTPRVI